jgi:chemotaxis protein histidine kinase CheA
MDDSFVLDLFREEVRSHAQVLNEGLVALERAPADARQIEPLMRAAHSIKGAARVVAVEPAVKVAHLMEESLVKVQKGELTLGSGAIDVLLRGVDTLTQIAVVAGPEFAASATFPDHRHVQSHPLVPSSTSKSRARSRECRWIQDSSLHLHPAFAEGHSRYFAPGSWRRYSESPRAPGAPPHHHDPDL